MLDIVANPGQPSAINFFVRGYANQRSHRTVDGVPEDGVGYSSVVVLPTASVGILIPLGFNAATTVATVPHALLDSAQVRFVFDPAIHGWANLSAYFILEYA